MLVELHYADFRVKKIGLMQLKKFLKLSQFQLS